METTMAQGLHITDENAGYDAACKRVLSEKAILARIMKACLEEYKNCDVNDIAGKYIEGQPQVSEVPVLPDESGSVISGMDTEDKSIREGSVTYDIRFRAVVPGTEEQIGLIINVEAQNDFYPGYPIITRYRLVEEQLVGEAVEPVENYDLLSIVMLCLGGPGGGNYEGVLRMLDVLLSNETSEVEKRKILQDDYGIQMTQTMEQEVSVMCNLSKGVEEKGMAKGMTNGILASIKNLVKNLGMSVEQAMSVLEVPEAERQNYRDLLERQ